MPSLPMSIGILTVEERTNMYVPVRDCMRSVKIPLRNGFCFILKNGQDLQDQMDIEYIRYPDAT